MYRLIQAFRTLQASLVLLLLGCAAPHDNPLDPDSKYYRPPQEEPTPPVFQVRVLSRHISRNFPATDFYSILPQLRGVSSQEADTVCVKFKAEPQLSLGYDSIWAYWGATLPGSSFGDPAGEAAVGWPFTFRVVMHGGIVYTAGPAYLARVITGTPALISPMDEDTVGAYPALNWEPYAAEFPFGFLATIIDISAADTIWVSSLMTEVEQSVLVSDSLPVGEYYWTITVVDSFGNISRSKEGDFRVDTTGSRGMSRLEFVQAK